MNSNRGCVLVAVAAAASSDKVALARYKEGRSGGTEAIPLTLSQQLPASPPSHRRRGVVRLAAALLSSEDGQGVREQPSAPRALATGKGWRFFSLSTCIWPLGP